MTAKRRISYWQRFRRVPAMLAASAALAAATGGVIGAPPRDCVDCRCTVDGVCIPNATTYGYYQTSWRTWPKPLSVSTRAPRTETKLPTQVEPPPAQEDLDNAPRPPASSGETPPVKPATGDEQLPPKTDKPDPFQDDPVQSGEPLGDAGSGHESSILVPDFDEPVESYSLIDEAPAVEQAVQSRYDEEPRTRAVVAPTSSEAALRLVDASEPPLHGEPSPVKPKAKSPAPTAAAEGTNPLRSGWGVRGESPLREPKVVSQFGGAAATNPLRK